MSWFKKKPNFGFKIPRRREAPDGQWLKCDGCGEILYARELERNLRVCKKCGHHFKIGCRGYVELLVDPGSFEERFDDVVSVDPLGFRDSKRYTDRLKETRKRTQLSESVLTGIAALFEHRLAIGVMDFAFMGGTLGSATGERLRRVIELAVRERRSLVIVSTSGGARMQEGILSLMQMAKTSDALADLYDAHLPFISVLLNPTTAGVAASYAALGDVVIAEPGAMIGFAGPRVIQQTINQELPQGFQTAEFVLEHGMIDMIVPRQEMRATVGRLLDMLLVPVRTESLVVDEGGNDGDEGGDGERDGNHDGGIVDDSAADAAEETRPGQEGGPGLEPAGERRDTASDNGDGPAAGSTPEDGSDDAVTQPVAAGGDGDRPGEPDTAGDEAPGDAPAHRRGDAGDPAVERRAPSPPSGD